MSRRSSEEEVMEVGKGEKRRRIIDRKRNEEERENVVGSEEYLPRMLLRVLLVEDDDSTRQIVSALLRKCGYTVSAVSDGLKAWETLKEKARNIDLILTEVELPLISGFALLSLVMEHEVCKNIPVIMMSSQDSISMVFKCMLQGAADYLIKPLRTNELRNLWQHAWRKHNLLHRQVHSTAPPQKAEPAYEKIAASNPSCDYEASSQNTKECSEKGSVAQSSCTTPYLEAESEQVQNMQDISQIKCGSASNLSKNNVERHEKCAKLSEELVIDASETGGNSNLFKPEVVSFNRAFESTVLSLKEDHIRIERLRDESVQPESFEASNANITAESQSCCDELVNPSTGAIDLIGTFDVRPRCTSGPSIVDVDGFSNYAHAPQLELSLRGICPKGSKSQGSDERPKLNHSNASAFSWYNNSTTLQSLFSALPGKRIESEDGPNKSEESLFNQSSDNFTVASQQHDSTTSNSHDNNLVAGKSGHTGLSFPSPQLGLIPVKGLNLDNLCSGYSQFFPSFFYVQSSSSPMWSPVSESQGDKSPFAVNNASDHSDIHYSEETSNNSIGGQTKETQSNLELEEDLKPSSLAAYESNGVVDHVNSCAHGRSDESATSAEADEKAISALQSLNDNGHLVQERFRSMDSVRISQREAALAKFRMKRKDRCYEKKVRYQSRKRLAEQRPRIRGQFVRQSETEHPPIANGS
ncbi:two-component response regulator-like PRR95 isoform X2 [Morus notabilis]|nr:two-component response regulator-like PRR95 isoform X2 [Morus notabilis]